MLSLGEAGARLTRFWMGKGCAVVPPSDLQIPLAIMHPEIFFRLPGPEPLRAAHLQPVRRPVDGRGGAHPFRLARHLQFQVLLKEPPAGIQTLYLDSLRKLGFRLRRHDLRFRDRSWESETLAAWGVGWRVLLDGLEISRITFLQQAGEVALEPVSVEILYGLERLLLVLTGAGEAGALPWGHPPSGSRRRRQEAELGRYCFEVADVGLHQRRLEDIEVEAGRCLQAGLVLPAYELAISGLQVVDFLTARGQLLGRDREAWLGRLRRLVVAAVGLDRERAGSDVPAGEGA